MIVLFASLIVAIQQTSVPARRAPVAAQRTNLEVRVSDLAGAPAPGIRVTAEGPLSRASRSNDDGRLTLWAMTPGTYRVRADGDGFVALEKDVTIRPGAPQSVEFALSAAPPPPPAPAPPPPPPPSHTPTVLPGEPRVLSLPDLAERSLGGREAFKAVALGCSGLSRVRLLVLRENAPPVRRPDVDESLYLVAGEATLQLDGKQQVLSPGWFSLVPRGSEYSLTRKGRNPAVLLAVAAGSSCDDTAVSGAR